MRSRPEHYKSKPGPTFVVILASLGALLGGCHAKEPRVAVESIQATAGSRGDLSAMSVETGRSTIVAACAKESYATARSGVIVSETGLREDVLLLRDRVSYDAIPYRLDETQKLEARLDAEIQMASHPEEQTECIRRFKEHLESLTAPLVEAEKEEKAIDASVFNEAAKREELQGNSAETTNMSGRD